MLIHLGYIIYKNMFQEFQECSDFLNIDKTKQNIDTTIFTFKSNIYIFIETMVNTNLYRKDFNFPFQFPG